MVGSNGIAIMLHELWLTTNHKRALAAGAIGVPPTALVELPTHFIVIPIQEGGVNPLGHKEPFHLTFDLQRVCVYVCVCVKCMCCKVLALHFACMCVYGCVSVKCL